MPIVDKEKQREYSKKWWNEKPQEYRDKCNAELRERRAAAVRGSLGPCDCECGCQRNAKYGQAGKCDACSTMLKRHGECRKGYDFDDDTPTWVYLICLEEEELIKVGLGFDKRVREQLQQGWKLLNRVSLPRDKARLLEQEILGDWFDKDKLGLPSLKSQGDERRGSTEMTGFYEDAIIVANKKIDMGKV